MVVIYGRLASLILSSAIELTVRCHPLGTSVSTTRTFTLICAKIFFRHEIAASHRRRDIYKIIVCWPIGFDWCFQLIFLFIISMKAIRILFRLFFSVVPSLPLAGFVFFKHCSSRTCFFTFHLSENVRSGPVNLVKASAQWMLASKKQLEEYGDLCIRQSTSFVLW